MLLDLRPEILETLCTRSTLLHLALEWQRTNPSIKLDITSLNQSLHIPYPRDIILYHTLQELLTNISKYATGNDLNVCLRVPLKK